MKIFTIILIIFASSTFIIASELPVFYSSQGVYIRKGFDITESRIFPPQSDQYYRLDTKTDSFNIAVIAKELDKSLIPESQVEEYTILTAFFIDRSRLLNKSISLNIDSIGENWEILLNGKRVNSHIFYSKNNISFPVFRQALIVELPINLLTDGYNTIAVRLAGRINSRYFNSSLTRKPVKLSYYEDAIQYQQKIVLFHAISGTFLISILFVILILCLFKFIDRFICSYLIIGLAVLILHPLLKDSILFNNSDLYTNLELISFPLINIGIILLGYVFVFRKKQLLVWIPIGITSVLMILFQIYFPDFKYFASVNALILQIMIVLFYFIRNTKIDIETKNVSFIYQNKFLL
jgi:hypothetical protein